MNLHFKIVLRRPFKNYQYLCGGTIEEVGKYLIEEDKNRDDGINTSLYFAKEIIGKLLTQTNKLPPSAFWTNQWDNGLVITVYMENT